MVENSASTASKDTTTSDIEEVPIDGSDLPPQTLGTVLGSHLSTGRADLNGCQDRAVRYVDH